MPFFPNSQNPTFYQCSFSDASQSSSALQVLLSATSLGAAYNSEERYPPPRCLPRTRIEIQRRIAEWADEGKSRILWLHGPAGAGKTAVAQTICETWAEKGQLLASFFFSRSSSTRNTIKPFIPTIACQAIHLLAGQLSILLQEVELNPALLAMEASAQLERLCIQPLQNVLSGMKEDPCRSFFMVFDGLDECEDIAEQRRILDILKTFVTSPCLRRLNIRILIASRPEMHIRYAFSESLASISSIESLYGDLKDVHTYLSRMFQEIRNSEKHSEILRYIEKPWPGREVIQTLTERSGGYFIYAATVVRYVDEEGYICTDRLDEILHPGSHSSCSGSSPYMEMDKVYSQVLSSAHNMPLLSRILRCMIVGRQRIVGFDELGPAVTMTGIVNVLLNLRPGELATTIRGLHSIIQLLAGNPDDLRFYHASFSDYLLDERRSGCYHLDYEATVKGIYQSSLNLMYFSGPPPSFTPTTEWAIGMMSWSRLAKPVDWLVDHIRSISPGLTFKPLIDQSESWSSDKQYRLINGVIRVLASLENSNATPQHQVIDLAWLCHVAFSYYFSVKEMGRDLCLPMIKARRDTVSHLSVPQQAEDAYIFFKITSSEVRRGVYTFLEFLDWGEDRFRRARPGSDDKITICLEEHSSFNVIDTRSMFSSKLLQFLDNLEELHLIDFRTSSSLNIRGALERHFRHRVGGATNPHIQSGVPRDPDGTVYRWGFGVRTRKGGVYGSDFILRRDGTIHCSTYWKANDETMKQGSKSASCVIPLVQSPSHVIQTCDLKDARRSNRNRKLEKMGQSNTYFIRVFWEEADRRRRWIETMHREWHREQVKLGHRSNHPLSNHDVVEKELQKVHYWLKETLQMTDSEGLQAWKKGEAGRQQQLLDLWEQQFCDQRDRDSSWEKRKEGILMAVDQRQLELEGFRDHSIATSEHFTQMLIRRWARSYLGPATLPKAIRILGFLGFRIEGFVSACLQTPDLLYANQAAKKEAERRRTCEQVLRNTPGVSRATWRITEPEEDAPEISKRAQEIRIVLKFLALVAVFYLVICLSLLLYRLMVLRQSDFS